MKLQFFIQKTDKYLSLKCKIGNFEVLAVLLYRKFILSLALLNALLNIR